MSEIIKTQARLETQLVLRQKYGLPNRNERFEDCLEYMRRMEEMARAVGFEVRDVSEFDGILEEQPTFKGVCFDERRLLIVRRDSIIRIEDRVGNLEHEVIHAIQADRYPRMPLRRIEYEAYMAIASPTMIASEDRKNIGSLIRMSLMAKRGVSFGQG